MKRVVKRRRLRRWVKVTLKALGGIAVLALFIVLFKVTNDRYNDMYEACDNARGYTCSYYEARQYAIRGE